MAVPKAFITDAELEVLKVLWSDNALTAREITTRLYGEENPSSIGTVQKLIQRLEEKDLLKRDRREPAHRFSAQVTRESVAGMQLQEFADKLSDGSLSPFIMHLVQAERLSKKDKQALRRLLGEE
jgi:BlaI family transcriptional regulator, penicillinase repressor